MMNQEPYHTLGERIKSFLEKDDGAIGDWWTWEDSEDGKGNPNMSNFTGKLWKCYLVSKNIPAILMVV